MKFAHMADIHLSAFATNRRMRELITESFERAYDICIERGVDFIIIAGDMLHTPTPEYEAVVRAVNRILKAKSRGINTYVVQGSHDYSHTKKGSILGILDAAGLIRDVAKYSVGEGNKLILEPVRDPATGAWLCGISANPGATEAEYYRHIDTAPLERLKGNKIFVFHTAVREMRSKRFKFMDEQSVQISELPPGFCYYATGHIHERMVMGSPDGNGKIVFPGPLVGSSVDDLRSCDDTGFYIVEVSEDGGVTPEFVPLDNIRKVREEVVFREENIHSVSSVLRERIDALDLDGALLILEAVGTVHGGPASLIKKKVLSDRAYSRGARAVIIHDRLRGSDTAVSTDTTPEFEDSRENIEMGILRRHTSAYAGSPVLERSGMRLASSLLDILRREEFSSADDLADHIDISMGIRDDDLLMDIVKGKRELFPGPDETSSNDSESPAVNDIDEGRSTSTHEDDPGDTSSSHTLDRFF